MPFEFIGKEMKKLRLAQGIALNDAADKLGIPAPNLCDIEAGRRYVGMYSSGLAALFGGEIFMLVVREAELRGLRPAAEVAVDMLLALASPITGGWTEDPNYQAETEQSWRQQMLDRDLANILNEKAVLAELAKHWRPLAIKAGFAGPAELQPDELAIVRDVIAKALKEQTDLQAKIREVSD